MLDLILLRHGCTRGNRLKRYIGTTDEPILPEERIHLAEKQKHHPEKPDAVFASPLQRCRETAGILFPSCEVHLIPAFSECDFGAFENKNYLELAGDPDYQAWIDSGGTLPFPGGESREQVEKRTAAGLVEMVSLCAKNRWKTVAAVVHGGTIMTLLSLYGTPKKNYYDWHVGNGEGYRILLQEEEILHGTGRLFVQGKY